MSSMAVLFAVFAATMGNATVFATVGLFGRHIGPGEFEIGTIFASSALLFLLTSGRWGRLADRRGRRPVIVVGLVGTALSLLLFAALGTLSPADIDPVPAFAALLTARVLYGVLAGGTQPASLAYMADVTTGKERSVGAALIGASVGLGSITGPVLAALLVGYGIAVPLLVAGALVTLASITTGIAVRDIDRFPAAKGARSAPSIKPLAPYLIFAFAMYLGFAALQPTMAFYVQDLFEIDTTLAIQQAGLVSAAFASCSFAVQLFVVRRFRITPHWLLAIGTAICLLGLVSCLMASHFHWLLAAFGIVGMGYGLAQPGLTAGALLAGDSDKQGQAAGYLQAAGSAAWIVGALVGTAIYAFHFKGPLLLAFGSTAAGTLALLALKKPSSAPA